MDQVYLRSTEGECDYAPANKGVEQWLGPEGYRITVNVGDYEFVIRRGGELGEWLGSPTTEATIVVRKRS